MADILAKKNANEQFGQGDKDSKPIPYNIYNIVLVQWNSDIVVVKSAGRAGDELSFLRYIDRGFFHYSGDGLEKKICNNGKVLHIVL